MITTAFVDPYSKQELQRDNAGNFYCRNGDTCHLYKNHDGIHDFVLEGTDLWKEREYYDQHYACSTSSDLKEAVSRDIWWKPELVEQARSAVAPFEVEQQLLREYWAMELFPWRKTLLDSIGDIRDKKVLLLGNGESCKELYFLVLGAKLVYTDLSLKAVIHQRSIFASSSLYPAYRDSVEFHAVDALNLPFKDEEFDVIYAASFVHHLEDMNSFVKEVYRCLAKGGVCRFLDAAYSPVWGGLKKTVLYPAKALSHWLQPRSPEDLHAEKREAYTLELLSRLMEAGGFRDMVFLRESLFLHLVVRHYGKLFKYDPAIMRRGRKIFELMRWLDNKLRDTTWMKGNSIVLTWGFDK